MSPTPFLNPSAEWDTTTSVDILVAALFLIAAGWLVLAIIYSALILIVVRMRSRGELDIYDENFGRIFLFGGRCYIPLGCLLRRHVVALNRRNHHQTVRLMTRGERRSAMEELLADAGHTDNNSTRNIDGDGENGGRSQHQQDQNAPAGATDGEDEENNDLDSNGEPVCSICLMEYEEDDVCFTSRTCVHKFHRDCILDWLERRDHTECPCCREPMVADEDVWDSVQLMRRQRRKLRRRQTREKGVLGLFSCFCASCCCCIVVADNSFQEGEEIDDVEEGNVTGIVEMEANGRISEEQNVGLGVGMGVGMGVPFGGNHEAAIASDSEGTNSHEPSIDMGVPGGDVEHEAPGANPSEDVNSNESSVGMGVPCGDVEHEVTVETPSGEVPSHESSVGMGVPCGDVEKETAADATDSE